MKEIYIPILCGILGGFVNCLLFEKGFVMPIKLIQNNRKIIDIGFLSNLIMGMVASIIIWGLGANGFEPFKMIATCTLSGIGGGSLIINLLLKKDIIEHKNDIQRQKESLLLEKEKTESLYSITRQLLDKDQNNKKRKKK
jgi:hypothetical protein